MKRRVRLKEARCEIDVVAAKEGLALVIDCKHWKRSLGYWMMRRVVRDQIDRAKALASSRLIFIRGCDKFLPTILTLYSEEFTILDGVPIVPINLLSDFTEKVGGYLGELNVINLVDEPTWIR